jgi:hypothetical protein
MQSTLSLQANPLVGNRPEIQVRAKDIEPWIPRFKSTDHAGIASVLRWIGAKLRQETT